MSNVIVNSESDLHDEEIKTEIDGTKSDLISNEANISKVHDDVKISESNSEIKKYNVPKTKKNTLTDLLDIKRKEPFLDYIQYHLEELSNKSKSNKEENDEVNNVTLKILGLEIHFKKDKDGKYNQSFLNALGIDYAIFNKIRCFEDLELTSFIRKVLCKYNYSPIIKKICSEEKESYENLIKDTFLWFCYISRFKINMTYNINIFKKKILLNIIIFINEYLVHIFGIPKVSECLNIIYKKINFKLYNFNDIKENNTNSTDILLDIEKELKGNGCSIIVLKELKRLYDSLFYSVNIFRQVFNICFFQYDINIVFDNLFYRYVIENEIISTLLYQIKMIFNFNESNKDVLNFIKKFRFKK